MAISPKTPIDYELLRSLPGADIARNGHHGAEVVATLSRPAFLANAYIEPNGDMQLSISHYAEGGLTIERVESYSEPQEDANVQVRLYGAVTMRLATGGQARVVPQGYLEMPLTGSSNFMLQQQPFKPKRIMRFDLQYRADPEAAMLAEGRLAINRRLLPGGLHTFITNLAIATSHNEIDQAILTGSVLASIEHPTFQPADPRDAQTQAAWNARMLLLSVFGSTQPLDATNLPANWHRPGNN